MASSPIYAIGTGSEHTTNTHHLRFFCRHGFRCIDGSDDYGEVVPGAQADVVVLDYAAMTEDFLTPEQEEVDIVLARATSRHVRDLFVAGRRVVGDGVLFGLDLPDAEREFMERARRVAALEAEQAARHRRRREGVRAYDVEDVRRGATFRWRGGAKRLRVGAGDHGVRLSATVRW